MGCGTSRQTRVHPSGNREQLNGVTPVTVAVSQSPPAVVNSPPVQVQSIGVQTVTVVQDKPPTPSQLQQNDGNTVITVQPIVEDLDSTLQIVTAPPLQDDNESDKNRAEVQSLEEDDGTSANDKHSVERLQGLQVNLDPSFHTTAELTHDGQVVSKPLVELETVLTVEEEHSSAVVETTKDETELTIEEKDSTESDRDDEQGSVKDNDTPNEGITEIKEDPGPSMNVDEDRDVEMSTALKPADDLKSVVTEQTSAITDNEAPTAGTLDQPPESTTDTVVNDGKSSKEVTVTPSLFLKPILPLHDGLAVTTSEPRLPVLPPIKKQVTSELKSKSVSDLKRRSAGKVSERGDSNLVKNKHRSTASRSTSGSSLSRSRDVSGSSENVVKKSTSRESLRSGSHTHLKASSSSLLLQKNSGGLSSKKLSLSRESLKAANLVYTSSKSRESLKSGGRLSSRSKDSLKSNKNEGGHKTKAESNVETKDRAETKKLSNSNHTTSLDGKAEVKDQPAVEEESSENNAMSAKTEGQTSKKEQQEGTQDTSKEATADEHKTETIQPSEKIPTIIKESKEGSEVTESTADSTTQEDETKGEERVIETMYEIDHHTGQSEQSIVEAVEKSLKTKELGITTGGEPLEPPAVQPVITTVQ